MPRSSTRILQGNRETIQRICRVQVFTCPTFVSLRHKGFCIKHGWEGLRCNAVRMFTAECSCAESC